MTKDSLRANLLQLLNQLERGCGDGGCRIKRPTGQHTNGGCRCHPHDFARSLRGIADQLKQENGYYPFDPYYMPGGYIAYTGAPTNENRA